MILHYLNYPILSQIPSMEQVRALLQVRHVADAWGILALWEQVGGGVTVGEGRPGLEVGGNRGYCQSLSPFLHLISEAARTCSSNFGGKCLSSLIMAAGLTLG